MKSKNTIIQERDRRILRELGMMRVMTRDQAKTIGGFTSDSRVNRRLLQLLRAGLLRRIIFGSTRLYSLSRKGAFAAGVEYWHLRRRNEEIITADYFLPHQLAVNDVVIGLKYGSWPQGFVFERWRSFREPLTRSSGLIPDGYAEIRFPSGEIVGFFLEVDLGGEHGKIWRQKANRYLSFILSGHLEELFGVQRCRILVLLQSERRCHSIRKAVAEVVDKLFWFASMDAVRKEGFFAPIWLRPTGDTRMVLVK